MSIKSSRRNFLQSTGAAVITAGVWTSTSAAQSKSANGKLNIACIGTANRAGEDINGVKSESIVALVDVDRKYLDAAAANFKDARKYADYREMLEQEGDKIDAVVIGTTDHHHAPASLRAIMKGKHVYCEKPLTHTVQEARIITEAARAKGVATQLGTQIHAGDNYRRVVEIIQAGTIGDVTDVHVWVSKGWGGGERPEGGETPPPELNWDVWLGPAPERPYVAGKYHPANWRRWWDFGQGTLGDMGCHYMDLPFWALGLKYPTKIAAKGPPVHPETCPLGLTVNYDFAAQGKQPPLKLTWYDGEQVPKEINGQRVPANGVMFIGTQGMMYADYTNYRLFPSEKFSNFKPPEQSIPKSIGHHAEWIKACKDGSATTCNFNYSGPLTETVLLGNVSYRSGKALEWDAAKMKITNAPEAEKFLTKSYRPGWEVVGLA